MGGKFQDALDFFSGVGDVIEIGVGLFFDDDGGFNAISQLAGSIFLEGIQIVASEEAAKAALKAGESTGSIFFANAALIDVEAEKVRGRTDREVAKAQLQGARFQATQISNYLNSGITLEGSPLLVLDETADLIALEIQEIHEEGFDKAEVLEKQAEIEVLKADAAFDDAEFRAQSILVGQIADSVESVLGL